MTGSRRSAPSSRPSGRRETSRAAAPPSPIVGRPHFIRGGWRTALVLALFLVAFGGLTIASYTGDSATWDEPVHLAHGYAALTRGDYRLDPSHPPFMRMWAALPLLTMPGIKLDTTFVDLVSPSTFVRIVSVVPRKFLYHDNDGDRLLSAGRLMIVPIGAGLGVLLFCWAYEWLGFWPATVALALFTVEPNVLAHSSVVTPDIGAACFAFGTIYFLWRAIRKPGAWTFTPVVVCFVLALVSRFTTLLLGPIVIGLLAIALARRRALRVRHAMALVAVLFAASWLGIWAVYGFRYAPSSSSTWVYHLQTDPAVLERLPHFTAVIDWIDAHHLLPNAYSQGLLYSQSNAQVRSAFLAGAYSNTGWWYYFPVAFLIKTPIAVMLLLAGGLAAAVWRWRSLEWSTLAFVLMPPAIYMALAMTVGVNIGLRHILPIYPFVLLMAAAGARAACDAYGTRARVAVAALTVAAAAELATAYPHTLTFFNQLVGGPSQGEHYLVDSNLDWGQDLKGLKRWMNAMGATYINLAYFGTAEPAYYHIDRTDLPGSDFFIEERATAPRFPGYVAVSATTLNGVYLEPRWREFYAALRKRTPLVTIGNTIHIYWVDQPWW